MEGFACGIAMMESESEHMLVMAVLFSMRMSAVSQPSYPALSGSKMHVHSEL